MFDRKVRISFYEYLKWNTIWSCNFLYKEIFMIYFFFGILKCWISSEIWNYFTYLESVFKKVDVFFFHINFKMWNIFFLFKIFDFSCLTSVKIRNIYRAIENWLGCIYWLRCLEMCLGIRIVVILCTSWKNSIKFHKHNLNVRLNAFECSVSIFS